MKLARKNIYTHKIRLKRLRINNAARKDFAEAVEKIPYSGYEVEDISDGRKIVITKPGGKSIYGRMKKEDFLVFIYNPKDQTLWQISHRQIYSFLEKKSLTEKKQTITLLRALRRVYDGAEPDTVLKTVASGTKSDAMPEIILKAYKWIWGQEDVNYPEGKGRAMSWEGWKKKDVDGWTKTGTGLGDLLSKLEDSNRKS